MLVSKHLHQARNLHLKGQFGDRLLDRLEATDAQRETLKPILESYGGRLRTLRRDHERQRAVLHDSLHLELDPLLTDEQRQEAQRWRALFEGKRPPRRRFKK